MSMNTNDDPFAICRNAWPYAQGEPLVKGQLYFVVRRWFENGEGWMKVKLDGKFTTAPSVFFGE